MIGVVIMIRMVVMTGIRRSVVVVGLAYRTMVVLWVSRLNGRIVRGRL